MAMKCPVRFAAGDGRSTTTPRVTKGYSVPLSEKDSLRWGKSLLKKWTPLLELTDWTINLAAHETGVLVTPDGETVCMGTIAKKGTKSAIIRISYDYDWNGVPGHDGFELSFVHELLHIINVELGVDYLKKGLSEADEERWGEYEEDHIDRHAKMLIKAFDKL